MTTTPASRTTAPITTIFAINDGFVLPALDGLTEDQLWQAPTERNNAILWIAGHVVQTRAMLLQLLGDPVDTGWGTLFDRGAPRAGADAAGRYPSRADIERTMREVTPRLHAKLGALDEVSLVSPLM
jgi:DinB superfamily